MGRIRVLDAAVQNQIAAGEVIERPASVVKELVENSLDAGAARIEVAIEGGGADRILVGDDGAGMEREDAVLAFERHATSKIREADDLRSIHSFGFRGEALPSIASVARVVLTTSPDGREGSRVRIRAGALEGVEPAAHPRGTTVEVEGLFQNAPARRKFLRSPGTEAAHVADTLLRVAAAHPAVAFRLVSGGREAAVWPAAGDLAGRVAQFLAGRERPHLVPVERRAGAMRVAGLAGGPALDRSTPRDQYLFVNGRPIRDRRLLHAIADAYATLLPKGRYPVVWLFLEIPPGEVDVNVHPAKTEVRFLRITAVHDLVREALRAALGGSRPFAPFRGAGWSVAEPVAPSVLLPAAGASPDSGVPVGAAGPGPPSGDAGGPGPAGATLFAGAPVEPLAQYRDSYILASAPDGLVIVDQHAAHERVLYERLIRRTDPAGAGRQRLLFPVIVEVGAAERQAFEEAAATLEGLGFVVVPFGGGTLRVEEIPATVPAGSVDRLLRELLAEAVEWRRPEGLEALRHRFAATAACHSAVTARHPLDPPRMRRILLDLLGTERPLTCPHGRPALLRLTLDDLEKGFHRR
jgi:DNA mismatch repair protein MutL